MNDVPVQLIVAAFQEEKGADETLKQLKMAKWVGLIGIKDAAVIRRDQKDKIHIKDVRDVGGGRGTIAGGIFGVGIALLTGGAGIILAGATGALVGGLAAKKIDMGLPNKRLKELGDALKPGTSAIIAVIEHKWVKKLEEELAEAGAEVATEALKADIAQQLEAGKDVAYSVTATEEAVTAGRTVADEEMVEMGGITVTEEGVSAQAMVMTEEGAVAKNVLLTEEGVVAATVVSTADEAGEEAPASDEDEEKPAKE